MPKRFTAKRILLAMLIIILNGCVAIIIYTVGNFYQCLDDFSGQVVRDDAVEARSGLEKLKYFYDLNSALPRLFSNFVGSCLFKNAKYYQAEFDYMTGRQQKAIDDLKNESGYYANQITGNAKWRIAQAVYKMAPFLSDPKVKKEQIEEAYEMASSTKDDYEKALRARPNSHEASWNYELMTMAGGSAMRAAIQPKEGKIKVRLGLKNKGKGRSKGDGPGGGGNENLGESGDEKGKPNPSNRRPG